MATDIEKQIDKLAADSDLPIEGEEQPFHYEPVYRMVSDDKIPVSKKLGKLWKSRKDAAWAHLQNSGNLDRWEEANRYYRNDHKTSRNRDRDIGDHETGTRLTSTGTETENIVFANVTALVPATYAKNPTVEISMDDVTFETFGRTAEKLVNTLMRLDYAPGINLKPKARRAVLNCTLNNISWFIVGYNIKEASSDKAMEDLDKVAKKLQETKDLKEIALLEGELEALESKIDLLSPSAPIVDIRCGRGVLVDPDATLLSEARWIMYHDYVPTGVLKALYGKPAENDSDEYKSVFEPTHILRVDDNSDGVHDSAAFSFLNKEGHKDYKDYGYSDEESFKAGWRSKVWYVWDKITRRVFLFNDCDWKWPLWVWDDPYGYPDFFPVIPMSFYDDPEHFYSRSETMMYLDQQDAINAINNEVAKVRSYISGKVIYNKKLIKDESIVDAFLAGTNEKRAIGIDAPAETDLTKLFAPFVPQSAQALNTIVFDKARLLEAVDRVSSVTNVMRGVEFKTNTTNKAIESYESTTATRLDEKIDAIEDAIGKVGQKLLHVCLLNMDGETVARLIGQDHAAVWEEHRQAFIDGGVTFSATVVGGSTLKPTSATKKQQAVQLSQALGQFASASPMAILIALKVMERAFDEVVITSEDWQQIIDSIQQQLQRGGPGQGGEGGEEGAGLEQVEKMIDSFPDEAKQFLAKMIAEGTPIRQAVGQVVKELQGSQAADESGEV